MCSYRDQFALLAEATAKEREEVVVREKAQNQVSQQSMSAVEGLSVDVLFSFLPSPPLLRWHSSYVVSCDNGRRGRFGHSRRVWIKKKMWPISDNWMLRASNTNLTA